MLFVPQAITRTSDHLIIHLKRLSEELGTDEYAQHSFPDSLSMSPYIMADSLANQPQPVSCAYTLQSLVVHTVLELEDSKSGHYVAFVRDGDAWSCCDDSQVSVVTSAFVHDMTPFLLFYKRAHEEPSRTVIQLSRQPASDCAEAVLQCVVRAHPTLWQPPNCSPRSAHCIDAARALDHGRILELVSTY